MEQENEVNCDSAKNLLRFQYKRNILNISKQFLIILEDINEGEEVNFDKRRKRILDSANDAIREFETQLNSLTIEYH